MASSSKQIARRRAWIESHTHDEVRAAEAARLARRALKNRLRTCVDKRRNGIDYKKETRCVQLAHGFIRGRAYGDMERICYTRPNWDRVTEIVMEYSFGDPRIFVQGFSEWIDAARAADNFKGYEPTRLETLGKLLHKQRRLNAAISALSAGATTSG